MPEVHFIGEIESAEGFSGSNLFTKWRIDAHAPHWRLMDGATVGRSWLSLRDHSEDPAVFNEPIACCYSTSNVSGWPSLLLQLYTVDYLDRVDLGGYGVVRLPITPGYHRRTIVISRPRGSWLSYLASIFLGGYPRYVNPDVLYSSAPRFGHRTESVGTVNITITVVVKGFDHITLPHIRMGENHQQLLQKSVENGLEVSEETIQGEEARIAESWSVCDRCPQLIKENDSEKKENDGGEAKHNEDKAKSLADAVAMAVQREMEQLERKSEIQHNIQTTNAIHHTTETRSLLDSR